MGKKWNAFMMICCGIAIIIATARQNLILLITGIGMAILLMLTLIYKNTKKEV